MQQRRIESLRPQDNEMQSFFRISTAFSKNAVQIGVLPNLP
jgi:hypothetical protein